MNLIFPVSYCILCCIIFLHKNVQFLISKHLLCEHKGPETFHSELLTELEKQCSLSNFHETLHHNLCSLDIVDDLSGLLLADEYRHLLALTGEWEVGNDLIVFIYSLAVLDLNIGSISFDQFHFDGVGILYKGDLVGATGLEDHFGTGFLNV